MIGVLARLCTFTPSLIVLWSVATFGAPYAWARGPLAIVCLATGIAGLVVAVARSRAHAINGAVTAAFGLVAAAIAAQLVPLGGAVLAVVSPQLSSVLRAYDVPYALQAVGAVAPAHALSINPDATWLGLSMFVSLAVYSVGLAAVLTSADVRRLAQHVAVIGGVLAMIAILQRATFNGKLFWFWAPENDPGNAFGPFVNRNHFAGWMIMALMLAIGGLLGRLATVARRAPPREWQRRLLWLASAEANRRILTGFLIVLMAMSLVLTTSRSGLVSFLAAMSITGVVALRRLSGGAQRVLVIAYLGLIVIVAVNATGVGVLQARFHQEANIVGRIVAWQDTLDIVRDFPLTGTGLNTYGDAMLFYQQGNTQVHMAQAHNDYLQLAAEGGWLLGVPAAIALLVVAREIRRRFADGSRATMSYWLRLSAVTGLVAIGLQETVEFSLQMPGNAAVFATLLAVAIGRLPSEEPAS